MRKKAFGIFILASAVLVLSWIRSGFFIATGESGLQFYNPTGVSEFYRYTWTEGAIGLPTSYAITSYPFLLVLGFLESIFSETITQAIFLFGTIVLGLIGVYELCRLIFSEENNDWTLYYVPPLFYTFNLFALVNIWNRLQYTFIIFYCFVPIGVWIYLRGLRKKQYKYALYLNLAMMPFVLAFSSIPLIELFWLVIGAITLYFFLHNIKSKRNWYFVGTYFLMALIAWILCNAWWLIQFVFVLKNSAYVTTQAYTSSGNTEAFSLLSSQLGNLSYVLRLMHREFFLNIQSVWMVNYLNPFLTIISFLVPFLTFFPLVLRKKPALVSYFLVLALLTVFFTKGDAPPFGFLFLWAFNHIRILEAFRNPFEKIGIILPLTYAPLMGYSLYRIREYAKDKHFAFKAQGGIILAVVLCIGILNFPYWNKLIFNNDYVQVPIFYSQANDYLNDNQKPEDPFRAIAVPMSGEGMTYNWGYSGVEVSNGLFTTPFISFSTSIQFFKPITDQVEKSIFIHPNNMYQMMQLLNAKYLLRRDDINFQERKITNPQYIEKAFANGISNISKDRDFDQLHFYKINEDEYLPRIYPSNKVILTDSEQIFNDILPYAKYTKNTVFLNTQVQNIPELNPVIAQSIIKADLASNDAVKVNRENALNELPSIRSTPDRWGYFLIRAKEKIEEWAAKSEDKDFLQVNRTSKRLVELDTLIKKHAKDKQVQESATEYYEYLNNINTKWVGQNLLAKEALLRQYYVLQAIPDTAVPNQLRALKDKLDQLITVTQAYPFDPNYYTYKIKINDDDGEYRLLLDSNDVPNNYIATNSLKSVIDGQSSDIPLKSNNNQLDLGTRYLDKGQHEIKIGKLLPRNLVQAPEDTFVLNSGKTSANPQYTITNFNPYERYQVSFDYFLRSGIMPELQFINDIDRVNNHITPAFHQTLPIRDKFYDWQSYSQVISPNTSARSASIGFKLVSWNNCEQLVKNTVFWENKCQNKQVRDFYTNSSEIIIKNLRVEKVFDSDLVAIKENKQYSFTELPKITFTKRDPTRYSVRVQNAQQPYVLILSEAFHPLWSAKVKNKKLEESRHQIANAYANSWIINEKGDYDIELNFEAESRRTIGSIITIISGIIFIIGIVLFRKNNYE